jgi:hypothetical protein
MAAVGLAAAGGGSPGSSGTGFDRDSQLKAR